MINWAQQAAGISTPILTTHSPLPHLEGKWINQLQHNLFSIKASIYIHDTWTYPPKYNMTITHLPDITTSDGTRLIETALTNPSEFVNQQLDLNWPIQDPPDLSTWKLWENEMCTIFRNHRTTLK
eukprot:4591595-Ditylum_brightwellii.AAC.1